MHCASQSSKMHFYPNAHGVPDPSSFQHLRIVNGVTYVTFPTASQALNLLKSYRHCDVCINDACNTCHPNQIQTSSVILLTSYFPLSPPELCDKHKYFMTEDIFRQTKIDNSNINLEFTD